MVLKRSCPAVSQKSMRTSLVPTLVRYLAKRLERAGAAPVQGEGEGGELLGSIAVEEEPLHQLGLAHGRVAQEDHLDRPLPLAGVSVIVESHQLPLLVCLVSIRLLPVT